MRVTPAIAAVPLLIVLLSWLSMGAANVDAEKFDVELADVDRFELLEAALHRDVLSARAGVLRNYDPLVQETNGLRATLAHLQETAKGDTALVSAIDRIDLAVGQQEVLIEKFKSGNAVLQNSLAYFSSFSARLGASEWGNALGPAVDRLAVAMLRLTLDTSTTTVEEVRDRLDMLTSQPVPFSEQASMQALLAHGRLLADLLPANDRLLKEFCAVPPRQEQEALRTIILSEQSAARTVAREFRTFLYATSLLLLGLLTYVGLQLQMRVRAQSRRAALEHVIADISMRFVSGRAEDLDSLVVQALAALAGHLGADRAYLLFLGSPDKAYTWARQGVAFPPGWPDHAPELMGWQWPEFDGIVHVPRVGLLPLGKHRDALHAIGLVGWACVMRTRPNRSSVLLGFDTTTHPCRIAHSGELSLLRVALDTNASAIGRHLLEQERSRLEVRLQQAKRLETVGAFASGIAHNFNNIMGAILGYAEMADDDSTSHSGTSYIIREIRRAADRARDLVDQILAFGRRRDVPPQPVSVRALIAEAASLLRASLPGTIEIAVGETVEDLVVSGVPTQLQQVILNLCNNAAQAMGYAGRIDIQCEAQSVAATCTLSHGMLPPGHYIRIAVADAGPGMEEATLQRLFEPFFTTRMTGNGLGLATTREIVREHKGSVNVQSILGVGSQFEIWLPRDVASVTSTIEDNGTLPYGQGETVLIVEDNPAQLLRTEETLAALGYEPVGFTHPADAQAACRAAPDRFDALLVGRLASMSSAPELAVALHAIAPELPILLVIASADDFDANRLMTAGIVDILAWPITAAELATALRNSLLRHPARKESRPVP